jgi:hypothetical protein
MGWKCCPMAAFAAAILFTTTAVAAPECYNLGYQAVPSAKPNKLHLYFPTADDPAYPEHGDPGHPTSPARAFDVTLLSNYTGTAQQLRDVIFDVVTDTYCEFNVEVLQTTAGLPTAGARRNTLAIGTDANVVTAVTAACPTPPCYGFGKAQNVDASDGTAVDFARIWAGSYQSAYGGAGQALEGVTNSTLTRWGVAIGGTAAHEAGHNYGLSHADGLVVAAGEDALTRHMMASGNNYNGEQRAGYRRHFSNHEYEILAANVGLSVQTMWNWDFVNPNAQTATKLRINFLSTQPALAVAGPYVGNLSPWAAPTVSAALGTQAFGGVTYNQFSVTWSTAQAWSGGSPGQVAGGASFHVGTGFAGVDYNTTNPIIITSVDLIDASDATLALHPRIVGFDAGTADATTADFAIGAFNFSGARLIISDIQVMFLPRHISISSMLRDAKGLQDIYGNGVGAWSQAKLDIKAEVSKEQRVRIPIAKLARGPRFIQRIPGRGCNEPNDMTGGRPDVSGCIGGMTAALFPATSTYITAVVSEPQARYWDAQKKEYVSGELRTRIFLQLAGRHVDLNKNGIDDFVEIATGKAKDSNKNGVIDELEKQKR